MAEKLPAPAVEPDPKVLIAIKSLCLMAQVQKPKGAEEIDGYARGFLMDHPAIALAETALRIITLDLQGQFADAADYTRYAEATHA